MVNCYDGSSELPLNGILSSYDSTEKENSVSHRANLVHPRPNLKNDYVAPRNKIEQVVAGIWQRFLKIERVGIHDNFFELGGDSLIIIEVISQIEEAFNIEIPEISLFEAPTVSSIAKNLSHTCEETPSFEERASRGRERRKHMQQRKHNF
jgi:acyl carrier protein